MPGFELQVNIYTVFREVRNCRTVFDKYTFWLPVKHTFLERERERVNDN